MTNGDPDAAFQAAPHRVDLTFTTPPYNHNAIEPHAAIAIWDGDDKVMIYDTSQFTAGTASSIAEIFGLKPENVRLISTYVGGGVRRQGRDVVLQPVRAGSPGSAEAGPDNPVARETFSE